MNMRNIVMISMESIRADHCSFLGYDRKTTPNLEKLADRGVVFERAYSPAPRTLPSMTSIFTGELITKYRKVSSRFEMGENARLNLKNKDTIAEKLSRLGYSTGAFNPSAYASSHFGFDEGFDFFQDFMFQETFFDKFAGKGKFFRAIRHIRNLIKSEEVFRNWESYYSDIVSWADKVEEPFFLWVFLLDTHFPYLTPRKYRIWINFADMYYMTWKLYQNIRKENVSISEKNKKKAINAYDNSLLYADRFFKNLVNDLSKFDPVYFIHGDHGEAFFERNMFGHFYPLLYEENLHVPLIIYNSEDQGRIKFPVSLMGLYNFLTKMFKSDSFQDNFLSENELALAKDICWREREQRLAIIRENWKYIKQEGNEELYNLEEDGKEKINKIKDYPKLHEEMKSLIEKYIDSPEKMRIKEKVSRL